MKASDIRTAAKLYGRLERLREALESLPDTGLVKLDIHEGPSRLEIHVDCQLFRESLLKNDIGDTKKALRDLGVEFPEDKK